jgi:predicted Zn-dependent protease
MNRRLRRALRVAAVALLASWVGCQSGVGSQSAGDASPRPYWPTRRDYSTFRAAQPDLLEPNYLPFMVHRLPSDDPLGDFLVFCRWPAEAMPLRVFVEVPEIAESLQDEFHRADPRSYVRAVETALARWEEQLEGLVRFQRVDDRADALLELLLVAEPGPEEADRRGLGRISLSDACRVEGADPDADRLIVTYSVDQLRIYLADDHGLLSPDQVTAIALHELGHALGMRSHSPIPADLMYEVVHDAAIPEPSTQDVNSFVSLYQIDNGSVFGHVPPSADGKGTDAAPSPPPTPTPTGPPKRGLAP